MELEEKNGMSEYAAGSQSRSSASSTASEFGFAASRTRATAADHEGGVAVVNRRADQLLNIRCRPSATSAEGLHDVLGFQRSEDRGGAEVQRRQVEPGSAVQNHVPARATARTRHRVVGVDQRLTGETDAAVGLHDAVRAEHNRTNRHDQQLTSTAATGSTFTVVRPTASQTEGHALEGNDRIQVRDRVAHAIAVEVLAVNQHAVATATAAGTGPRSE
jgi:hypothetical protein